MTISYIFHSCFTVELERTLLVFDFYKDTEDKLLENKLRVTTKPVYVFSSHFHADHFNRDCLEWAEFCDAHYILSHEIKSRIKRMMHEKTYDVALVRKGEVLNSFDFDVHMHGSTDAGVSFLVKTEGKTIFHAGDLNNWHWRDESTPEEAKLCETAYEKELGEIANNTSNIDVVMFPVDPRIGSDYFLGARQFIERIKTGLFVPMHFGDEYGKANVFESVARQNGSAFFKITGKGDQIVWK